MLKKLLYIIGVYCLGMGVAFGQQLQPKGYFLSDSVKLGAHAQFSLSLKHPKNMEILFPDSTFDFKSFEWVKKEYFPTQSDSLMSMDSVVYTVRTFEMDSTQYLSMPVYVISAAGDTTELASRNDSLSISFIIRAMPDSVQLKTDISHLDVPRAFNYPFFTLGSVFFALIVVLVWVFFGENIREAYRLRRLRRQYEVFVSSFDENLRHTQNEESANFALGMWKNYLEKLKNVPFSSLTSKEILSKFPNEDLQNSLKNIDRAVYGGMLNDNTRQALQYLKTFADNAYQEKLKNIKNA